MNQKSTIRENSKNFRLRKCPQHKMSHLQKVCIHPSCVESKTLNLFCNQCFRKHAKNHNEMIPYNLEFDKIFSENVLTDVEILENECLNVFIDKKKIRC